MITVPTGRIAEKLDGQLWHTIMLPAGAAYGQKDFFTASDEECLKGLSNVRNGVVQLGQHFYIERISLVPSLDSLPSDSDKLISNSTFAFYTPVKEYYSGPAQSYAKSRGLDNVMASIKKLPKKAQLELLQNLKIANGLELSAPFSLLELQAFRAKLVVNEPVVLKKDLKITCILDGTLVRTLHS